MPNLLDDDNFCSTVVGGSCLNKHPEIPINELLLELEALDVRASDARVSLTKENKQDGVIQCAKALGHEGLYGVWLVFTMKGLLDAFYYGRW